MVLSERIFLVFGLKETGSHREGWLMMLVCESTFQVSGLTDAR